MRRKTPRPKAALGIQPPAALVHPCTSTPGGHELYSQRLKRLFNLDIENCKSCGGPVKISRSQHPASRDISTSLYITACIKDPVVIEATAGMQEVELSLERKSRATHGAVAEGRCLATCRTRRKFALTCGISPTSSAQFRPAPCRNAGRRFDGLRILDGIAEKGIYSSYTQADGVRNPYRADWIHK